MSIAFILRMISNTISGKGGHPQSINEEIERAKKRTERTQATLNGHTR